MTRCIPKPLRICAYTGIWAFCARTLETSERKKILSDDDSSLSLLQYVSDFKNRLSKACEAARSNLKSAQSKMKLRYNENAQDRNFEPGD